ncbi:hypothetical protein [Streptomyces virginiae]|uniref:hypothetical protein n=1 Tax=Streptomyces virginiae TaxID=1961 RepID=UPI00345C889E
MTSTSAARTTRSASRPSTPTSASRGSALCQRPVSTSRHRDPEPLPYDAARAPEIVGRYDNDAITLVVDVAAGGTGLTLAAGIKPEIRAGSDDEVPADYRPESIGLLPGDGDEYIVTSGGLRGQRGFFTRDATGAVVGVDLAGRLFARAPR